MGEVTITRIILNHICFFLIGLLVIGFAILIIIFLPFWIGNNPYSTAIERWSLGIVTLIIFMISIFGSISFIIKSNTIFLIDGLFQFTIIVIIFTIIFGGVTLSEQVKKIIPKPTGDFYHNAEWLYYESIAALFLWSGFTTIAFIIWLVTKLHEEILKNIEEDIDPCFCFYWLERDIPVAEEVSQPGSEIVRTVVNV